MPSVGYKHEQHRQNFVTTTFIIQAIKVKVELDLDVSCIVVSITKCLIKVSTVMRRLTTGIRSEKCGVRRFRRCANIIECTYTNLNSIAYHTPRLYGIAYCS